MFWRDKLVQFIHRRRRAKFADMHSSVIALLGVMSFTVASYWGLAVSTVAPKLAFITNSIGFPPLCVALWLQMGGLCLASWYFGCIAARCHAILYSRWFSEHCG